MKAITNTDNVIDSRDIIERIEALTELIASELSPDDFKEAVKEYDDLMTLQEECEGADDWEYGATLIHEDHFEQYMDEMIKDCYELPDLPSFISITLDYDALKMDYFEVDFNGAIYYIR